MSTDVDAYENSRGEKRIRLMAAAISIAAAGIGNICYPVTTDIDRNPCSMAKRLEQKGVTRFKDCLRGILLNARP